MDIYIHIFYDQFESVKLNIIIGDVGGMRLGPQAMDTITWTVLKICQRMIMKIAM